MNGNLKFKHWWIFTFSIPFSVYILLDIFIINNPFKEVLDSKFRNPNLLYHIFNKGHFVYVFIVGIYLIKRLRKYRRQLKNNFSQIEHFDLRWLLNYTFFLVLLFGLALTAFLAYNIGLFEKVEIAYQIIYPFMYLGIIYLTFNGIKQYNVSPVQSLSGSGNGPDPKIDEEQKSEKYVNSPLNDSASAALYQNLENLIDKDQLFTETGLTISAVADRLSISSNLLSQAINTHFGNPFYDYIATKRVGLLKERLTNEDSRKYTILALGLDCGFSSKSSLNRIFKAHTGMTPSEFQKSHLGS